MYEAVAGKWFDEVSSEEHRQSGSQIVGFWHRLVDVLAGDWGSRDSVDAYRWRSSRDEPVRPDRPQQGATSAFATRRMIHSVFALGDTIVREVMVPRTEMVWIESSKTLQQALLLFVRSGFGRVPVIGDSVDDVLGVLYLKDVVRRTQSGDPLATTEPVTGVMRTATFVPESKPLDDLLSAMQAERTHLVIVVDEYGGTAGLVTIEDIVEEFVGEITDEYDVGRSPVQNLDDGSVRVTARLPVEDLGEIFGVELPADEVETVGGLLAQALGRVPLPGASADVNGLHLVAEGTTGRRDRIDSVLVSRFRGRLLVAFEMLRNGEISNMLQYGRQSAFQQMVSHAAELTGLDRSNWLTQQVGDGELAILPSDVSERMLVNSFLPTLDRLIGLYNRDRPTDGKIRLVMALHKDGFQSGSLGGISRDATAIVKRLADAPAVKAVLGSLPDANIALVLSGAAYKGLVQDGPGMSTEHFRRLAVQPQSKSADQEAWLFVPGRHHPAYEGTFG